MAGPRGGHHVVIRERSPADDDAIRRLNDAAFGSTFESRLVEDLRWARLAALELVAVDDQEIAGHVLFSALATSMDGEAVPTLALAPMSVRPDRQRQGIGRSLVLEGLRLARQREWWAVVVLGHAAYYPRFGFSAETARVLDAPFRGESFMALELVPGALKGQAGRVVYPPAFGIGR